MNAFATSAIFLLVVAVCQVEEATSSDASRRSKIRQILYGDPDDYRGMAARLMDESLASDVEDKSGRPGRIIELDDAVSDELRLLLKSNGRIASLADLLLWPFRRATPKPTQIRTSANNTTSSNETSSSISFEAGLEFISAIDGAGCVPRVICEINASQNDKSAPDEIEKLVVKMFEKPQTKKETAAGKLYRQAAAFGKNLKSPAACQNLYPSCKFPSRVLLNVLLGEPITKQTP